MTHPDPPTRDELEEQGLTVADAVARQYPGIVIDYAMPQDFMNAVRDMTGVNLRRLLPGGQLDRCRAHRRNRAPLAIKRIWLYPLSRDVRKRLCAPLCLVGEVA